MSITAQQLAAHLKGDLRGDGSAEITGVASVADARACTVTFAETPKHFATALKSEASVVIVFADVLNAKRLAEAGLVASDLQGKTLICVKNPRAAFAHTLELFFPYPIRKPGVHPTTVVGRGVQLGANVYLGPYVVVGDDVRIGAHTVIEAGVTIGEGTIVGGNCLVYPRVTIYPRVVLGNRVIVHAGTVIGSDGFGYVPDNGKHLKIPQIGNVIIEDDVEIGANTTIDRAALGSTVVKKGTKIDNLVQVAHNNTIGEHCLIAAQTGLAGSVTLGNYVVLAGQVGVKDHVAIGDQSIVGGQAAIIGDLPPKAVVWGTPAQPHREWLRQLAALKRLPEIIKTLTQKGMLKPPHEKK